MRTYDVIIAGAGPAGCTAAYELAKAGIKVLVLEKYTLPRFKCCAGGVTFKAAKNLPFDINELAEDTIKVVDARYKNARYEGSHDLPLLYTILRPKLDYALAKKAEAAGAQILQEQPIIHLVNGSDHVEVSTQADVYRAEFVIGADGARSLVAREAGFNNKMEYIAGFNSEIAMEKGDTERWKGKVLVDIGVIPGGYAWVFPKSDHLSVGIATVVPKNTELSRCYSEFLRKLEIDISKTIRKNGGLISISKGDPKLVLGRVLLVGDAAGLADPLSGEGVDNAIQSGMLAAGSIKQGLSNSSNLESYQEAVYQKIMPEIKIARVIQKLFINFPQVAIHLLHMEPRVWRACVLFVRGDLSYTVAKQAVGGYKGVMKLAMQAIKR